MLDHDDTSDIESIPVDRSNFNANVRFLEETGLLNKGIKILEIGCGAGRPVRYPTQRGFSVTRFDISKTLILKKQVRHPDTIIFIASGGGYAA